MRLFLCFCFLVLYIEMNQAEESIHIYYKKVKDMHYQILTQSLENEFQPAMFVQVCSLINGGVDLFSKNITTYIKKIIHLTNTLLLKLLAF